MAKGGNVPANMITLEHPHLRAFLSSWEAEDDACRRGMACELVDWLQEQEQTLADVVRLYAGTGPAFADGLPQPVLAEWCLATEPRRTCQWTQQGIPFCRWEMVRDYRAEVEHVHNDHGHHVASVLRIRPCGPYDVWAVVGHHIDMDTVPPGKAWTIGEVLAVPPERFPEALRRKTAEMQREVKRRVLDLFPEVEIEQQWESRSLCTTKSCDDGSETLWLDNGVIVPSPFTIESKVLPGERRNGKFFLPAVTLYVVRKTYRAPDLIRKHNPTDANWQGGSSNPLEDLRQMRERMMHDVGWQPVLTESQRNVLAAMEARQEDVQEP